MIEYEEPDSWDDRGMNWNSPDPTNVDYVMALRRAIIERCAAAARFVPLDLYRISPWKPVTTETMQTFVACIWFLVSWYFNRNWKNYRDDYSDFPRMWTYRDILAEDGCELWRFPKPGDLARNGGECLKAVRKALSLLTVVRCWNLEGTQVHRHGGSSGWPFARSTDEALEEAERKEKRLSGFMSATEIWAWSGHTHTSCPQADYDGPPGQNVDRYSCEADSIGFEIRAARGYLRNRTCRLLAYAYLTEPKGALQYADELEASAFDGGSCGFKKGMNRLSASVEKDGSVNMKFGDAASIPRNATAPVSDFSESGGVIYRRSAKRGYEGNAWFFLDYGVTGGFKFQ